MTPREMHCGMIWALVWLFIAMALFVSAIWLDDLALALFGSAAFHHSNDKAWRIREAFALRYGMRMNYDALKEKRGAR